MTVKELKELLKDMKDDKEVIANLNGKYFKFEDFTNSHVTNEIIFTIKEEY